MKKIICILICVCCFFSTTTSFASELRDVIIVDDEGDGDYTSIKEALAHANPGDTIEVYSGTYYEYNILIEAENITLQGIPFELGGGDDAGKPFIDGRGQDDLIEILASNVTIDGFRMEDEGKQSNNIILIPSSTDGCTISNNDIAYCTMSCIWTKGSYIQILNNNISHSSMRNGIVLRDPSHDNIVKGNVISDCETGILCWGSGNNLIERNIVRNCEDFGLDIGNYDNIIRYNTIEDNTMGIQLMSVRAIVSNNNFINNENHATAYNSRFSWMISNKWTGNYWGRGRILPYPILGQVFLFPWVQFDWRPAKVPYDISDDEIISHTNTHNS